MLNSYYTKKLLELQGATVTSIESSEENIKIYVQMSRVECTCPQCGKKTNRVHDYRMQKIQDLPAFGKNVSLMLRKRRYVCSCGKRFDESNALLPRYQRRTKRLTTEILGKLDELRSYSAIAHEYGLSVSTIIRIFNQINYASPRVLPEAISIDEFKGNSGGEKFNVILTDPASHKVLDIIKSRSGDKLCDYFRACDRSHVRYIVTDMYRPYADIIRAYFPNATYVIDKYHWIRQTTWALDAVRKKVQKRFQKAHRIYFKHSKNLLLKRNKFLTDEQKTQVRIMIELDSSLQEAYYFKEDLYRILDMTDPEKQDREFRILVDSALESEVKEIRNCGGTYHRWLKPILNSLHCPYTNGFTEGCNNKVKVLKRTSFGLRNFQRFRNRILYVFSATQQKSWTPCSAAH